jgi:hypothetical protein
LVARLILRGWVAACAIRVALRVLVRAGGGSLIRTALIWTGLRLSTLRLTTRWLAAQIRVLPIRIGAGWVLAVWTAGRIRHRWTTFTLIRPPRVRVAA